jgi:hypothetical protein
MITRRRDWFRILYDLSMADVPATAVARKCNRNVSTVYDWRYGSEPKESDARIVLALYFKHCRMEYDKHEKQFEVRQFADSEGAT